MGLFNFGKKKENSVPENNEKKAFHVTIRNNETGELLHDSETDAFICAYDKDESTAGCSGIKTDPITTAALVMAAQDQIKKLLGQHQELAFLISLREAMLKKEEQSDER